MSIDDAVGTMRQTGKHVPRVRSPIALQAPRWGAPAPELDVEELEAEAGHPLPADYRAFLLHHGSVTAMDVHNGYEIFSARQALMLTRRGDGPRHVANESGTLPVISIGADGAGNLFLLVAGGGGVLKWLHEHGASEQRTAHERALERVAVDFSTFLERVSVDWKHFVAGDSDWQYISGYDANSARAAPRAGRRSRPRRGCRGARSRG